MKLTADSATGTSARPGRNSDSLIVLPRSGAALATRRFVPRVITLIISLRRANGKRAVFQFGRARLLPSFRFLLGRSLALPNLDASGKRAPHGFTKTTSTTR